MARRELERDQPNDPWGRPPGHPMYDVPPIDTGPTPYGDPIDGGYRPEDPAPTPAPTPTPTPTPAPSPSPSFDLGPLLQPYQGAFTPPVYGEAFGRLADLLGPAPSFTAPDLPTIEPFSYEDYTPTTGQDVFADPSFGFRKGVGEQALLNSRAAQGLARTGGTLKDLLSYNQNFASQEFGNVDQRRRQAYDTNRGNAFQNWQANTDTSLGLYDRGFEGKRAEFEPRLYEWTTKGRMGADAEDRAYGNAFKQFQTDYDIWRNQQDDVFNRLKWASEFGAGVSQ